MDGSFGLTTLRNRPVEVIGSDVRFSFRGKRGKLHRVDLQDRRLARIIKRFLEIPGQELFQFLDESGEAKPIDSADVNTYLRDISGEDFTAKDFRTWAGTILAARFLRKTIARPSTRGDNQQLVDAIASCRRAGQHPGRLQEGYIHPAVIAAYLAGGLKPVRENDDADPYNLSAEERSLLALLSAEASQPTGRSTEGRSRSIGLRTA